MRFGRNWSTDVKLAVRALRRQPGSSAAVILTLALGIGATTATYAVFNVAVFRPVPGVSDPDHLVSIYIQPDERTPNRTSASFAHLTAMRESVEAVTGIADYSSGDRRLKIAADADAFVGQGENVSRDYFQTLGVRPRLGRLLDGNEYQDAAARTVVISERLWRSRFALDPAVVGHPLWINDVRFTIVGVAADFQGLDLTGRDDFWLPYASWRALDPTLAEEPDEVFQMIGRLRPHASLEAARVELARAFASAGKVGTDTTYAAVAFLGLTDGIGLTRARLLTMYRVLMTGVAMLLLLSCANAANLLLGQYVGRRRALGLRAAVGATRARLMREMLVESGTIALVAGGVGLAIGVALASLFRGAKLLSYLPALEEIQLDWRVAASAFAAATATVGLFALVPAWIASRAHPYEGLRETSRATGSASRLRPVLMAAQVSLSLALLVGTALLGQTVAHLRGIDLGFDPHGLLMEDLRPPYNRAAAVLFQVQDNLAARGGGAVAVSFFPPLSGGSIMSLGLTGPAQGGSPQRVSTLAVSPAFFTTMRMPLLAGRPFTSADADDSTMASGGPIILGESVARHLFGSPGAAIDRDVAIPTRRSTDTRHVVGVTSDIVWYDLRAGRLPSAFLPFTRTMRIGTIVMRTPLGAGDATALLREAVRLVDPSLPVQPLSSIPDQIDERLAQERLLARLGGVIAAIAAMLAMAGVYSVMACFVSERTREFGIRRALGASVSQVAGHVLRRVVGTGVVGLVCGAGLAVLIARSLSVWLFGVGPVDLPTIATASVVLLASAMVAAAVPAWRATKVDPAVALRTE